MGHRRLEGRLQGGFVTCIALRMDASGNCALASAGYPAPFLNGKEVALPGALPLGLSGTASYEEVPLLWPYYIGLHASALTR
jgi:hypothetical protein